MILENKPGISDSVQLAKVEEMQGIDCSCYFERYSEYKTEDLKK